MPKYFCGIDPGQSGGYAVLREDSSIVHTENFSSFKYHNSQIASLDGDVLFLLEKVHAMPRQGVSSMFTFGSNFGGWKALLEISELPYILVPPQTWQKYILGAFPKGESKNRAFDYVTRRYPTLNLKKSKDSGIVDAICMALYLKDNH